MELLARARALNDHAAALVRDQEAGEPDLHAALQEEREANESLRDETNRLYAALQRTKGEAARLRGWTANRHHDEVRVIGELLTLQRANADLQARVQAFERQQLQAPDPRLVVAWTMWAQQQAQQPNQVGDS